MYALEFNLNGFKPRVMLSFSSSTENQSMSSFFICKESDNNELLSKVTDRGKASMKKLLAETGNEASLDRKLIRSCIM